MQRKMNGRGSGAESDAYDSPWSVDIFHCSTGLPTPELAPGVISSPTRSRAELPKTSHEKLLWWLDPARSKSESCGDVPHVDTDFCLPDAILQPPWEPSERTPPALQLSQQEVEFDNAPHLHRVVESLFDDSEPLVTSSQTSSDDSSWSQRCTTAMLRNIPNKYMRDKLVAQLDQCGYKGKMDFLYLPIDFRNRCNVGYCFINFRTPQALVRFRDDFHGRRSCDKLPGFNSKKVLQVSPARVQGLEANILRLQGSPIMENTAMEREWLPVLLDPAGKLLDFPMMLPQAKSTESGKSARLSGFRSQAATRRKRASTNVAIACNSTMFQ
ncbi:ML4 [Symbiodinium sp. CCMP2456]|nr:ML4 [Symbiodinium sp. CCMP2456]